MMVPSLISVLAFLSLKIFIFQFDIVKVAAAPEIDEVSAMKYLARYGYMQIAEEEIKSNALISKGNLLISKEALTEALKEYQIFYNLKVTGKLDTQTVNQMQQPRCGVPDKFPDNFRKKRYILWGVRWNKKRVIFKILNTLKKEKYQVPLSAVESDFSRAMNLWQQYIPITLQLSTKSGFDPDVSVSFQVGNHGVNGKSFDGPGGVLAYASLPKRWPNKDAIIHFDGDESWYFENGKYGPGNGRRISFYQVATHELGHTLGLRHSSDRNAVMYPHYKSNKVSDHHFSLGSDDIEGIKAQYHNMKN